MLSRAQPRVSWSSLGIISLSLALAPPALAAPITGISTYQDLINTGTTGVIVEGLRFHSFALSVTGIGVTLPTASNIAVSDSSSLQPAVPGTQIVALRFAYAWIAPDNALIDTLISYRVSVVDPAEPIISVGAAFDGTAVPAGAGAFTSVAETVERSDGGPIVGANTVAAFALFSDGLGAGFPDVLSMTQAITSSTELIVTKDITANATNGAGEPMALISYVDNSFARVPEPQMIFILAGACLLARRLYRAT